MPPLEVVPPVDDVLPPEPPVLLLVEAVVEVVAVVEVSSSPQPTTPTSATVVNREKRDSLRLVANICGLSTGKNGAGIRALFDKRTK
jgi:hypothetical protein